MLENELKILGQRLLQLRLAKGVSAAEVARDALGYVNGSHVAVTRLERAMLPQPRVDHLLGLARYFAVAPAHLMAPEAEAHSPARQPSVTRPKRPERIPGDLPGRVRYVREALALDHSDFAAALRSNGAIITSGMVLAWESGESEPNPFQLRVLSLFARRSEEWFLHGEGRGALATPSVRAFWPGSQPAA